MDENASNTTCAKRYKDSTYYGLLYFRCALSIISILFILSMLSIMVLFKKYRFFTQRLILYLAISTLTYQFISAMDVTSVRAYEGDKTASQYCTTIAFLTQVMIWWPIVSTAVIVFEVFVRVVFDKSTRRLEVLYVFLIFFLSPLINWIPFVFSAYGPIGYFCWITNPSCTDKDRLIGLILILLLYYIPYYILSIIMVVLLVITAVVLRRSRNSYIGKYDPNAEGLKKKMENEIKPMMYYPIIFIISAVVSLIITVLIPNIDDINTDAGYIVIGTILSIVFRLQGVFLTLVFVLDPETRKKLNPMEMKAAAYEFFKKQDNLEYPAEYNVRSDSNTAKKRITVTLDNNITQETEFIN